MKRSFSLGIVLGTLSLALAQTSVAQDGGVYGRELMTEQERLEHRTKMRNFETEQEREAYRLEHHEQMQQRAKEMGRTLPDRPLARGRGMGPRAGDGYDQGRRKRQ